MDYKNIEKLAEVFEKLAQDITITENTVRAMENDLSLQFAIKLMKNFRSSYEGWGPAGEPPPIPPNSKVVISQVGPPQMEIAVIIEKGKISDQLIYRTIAETDQWLKTESPYRKNQYVEQAAWRIAPQVEVNVGNAVIQP